MRGIHRKGLTLTEVLVILVLVVVAAFLFFPALQHLRNSGARTDCQNNLMRLGLALTQYHKDHGHFPAGYLRIVTPGENGVASPDDTAPGWGWGAALLPYVNNKPLADQIDPSVRVEDPRFEGVRTTTVRVFKCAGDRNTGVFNITDASEDPITRVATNSYAANFGTNDRIDQRPDDGNGLFFANSKITIADLTHGTSNTLALGERGAILARTPWIGAISKGTVRTMPDAPVTPRVVEGAPVEVLAGVSGGIPLNDPASTPTGFFSPHPGAVLFALADGSARPFSTHTDLAVLQALASRTGGGGRKDDAE
jgi:type II secretory pathway pseudopilin PulG